MIDLNSRNEITRRDIAAVAEYFGLDPNETVSIKVTSCSIKAVQNLDGVLTTREWSTPHIADSRREAAARARRK